MCLAAVQIDSDGDNRHVSRWSTTSTICHPFRSKSRRSSVSPALDTKPPPGPEVDPRAGSKFRHTPRCGLTHRSPISKPRQGRSITWMTTDPKPEGPMHRQTASSLSRPQSRSTPGSSSSRSAARRLFDRGTRGHSPMNCCYRDAGGGSCSRYRRRWRRPHRALNAFKEIGLDGSTGRLYQLRSSIAWRGRSSYRHATDSAANPGPGRRWKILEDVNVDRRTPARDLRHARPRPAPNWRWTDRHICPTAADPAAAVSHIRSRSAGGGMMNQTRHVRKTPTGAAPCWG